MLENEKETLESYHEKKDIYRNIIDVVDALEKAQKEKINVNLLIGAGCSVTAGIPAAQGMVNLIKSEFPREFERAKVKNYPNCMSKLTPSERKNLISNIIENAKINWTHVAIAQLLKSGYINRILTPNFDNLIQRSCSLVGEFPAIYDLATSSVFRPDLLFDKSVIHLHGQHTGFILCNTEKEVESQSNNLKPIFEQLDQKSLWIIIGYSGENDPIFKLLAKKELFEHRLFWIGYEDNEPSEMLETQLLSEDKYAFFVKGFNSDDFFVKVSQKLGCFPPTFIQKPFTHLANTLDTLANYKVPSPFNEILRRYDVNTFNDIHLVTQNVIQEAIDTIETNKTLMAQHYLMAGLFDDVINLAKESTKEGEKEKINFEFEYQIINALRSRQQDNGDLLNALERLNKLDSHFPNNATIKTDLGTLYFLLYVRTRIPSQKESLEKALPYLKLSMEAFDKSQTLNNNIENLLAWDGRLELTFRYIYNDLDDKEKSGFLKDTLDKFFKHLHSFNSIPDAQAYRFQLTTIPYELVEEKEYEYAKFILDNMEKSKILSFISQAYTMANLGFWYFNNENISFETALQNGINFYQKALESLLQGPEIDSKDNSLYTLFAQKYLLERAKFLLKHNSDINTSIGLLSQCIQMGDKITVDSSIHKEAVKILESIQPQNTTHLQIASASTTN
ncbi:hypothetical protein [Bacillus wiedmannii]|uniref:hypothetical protein n=1 Tax=Bacillus wiedmannii TaxID=1890302 RepID=UPI003F65D661